MSEIRSVRSHASSLRAGRSNVSSLRAGKLRLIKLLINKQQHESRCQLERDKLKSDQWFEQERRKLNRKQPGADMKLYQCRQDEELKVDQRQQEEELKLNHKKREIQLDEDIASTIIELRLTEEMLRTIFQRVQELYQGVNDPRAEMLRATQVVEPTTPSNIELSSHHKLTGNCSNTSREIERVQQESESTLDEPELRTMESRQELGPRHKPELVRKPKQEPEARDEGPQLKTMEPGKELGPRHKPELVRKPKQEPEARDEGPQLKTMEPGKELGPRHKPELARKPRQDPEAKEEGPQLKIKEPRRELELKHIPELKVIHKLNHNWRLSTKQIQQEAWRKAPSIPAKKTGVGGTVKLKQKLGERNCQVQQDVWRKMTSPARRPDKDDQSSPARRPEKDDQSSPGRRLEKDDQSSSKTSRERRKVKMQSRKYIL